MKSKIWSQKVTEIILETVDSQNELQDIEVETFTGLFPIQRDAPPVPMMWILIFTPSPILSDPPIGIFASMPVGGKPDVEKIQQDIRTCIHNLAEKRSEALSAQLSSITGEKKKSVGDLILPH